MDELLHSRIKELKEIEDRLWQLLRMPPEKVRQGILELMNFTDDAIGRAEQEHADF